MKELRVVLFGATGMVGAGVLQCCLDDPDVSAVLVLGRRSCGVQHPKLKEVLHGDFYDYSAVETQLKGYNACLFPLGVSSIGMDEAKYSRLTYDLTIAAAEAMLRQNPGCSFCYITGKGTDSTEKGPMMWARVKGRTENKLLGMGFQPAVMLRPAAIQPLPGQRLNGPWYKLFFFLSKPLFPPLLRFFPGIATSNLRLGRAMLKAARGEAGKSVLENIDINHLGA